MYQINIDSHEICNEYQSTHLNCVGSSVYSTTDKHSTVHIIIISLLDNLHLVEKKSEHFPGNYCKKNCAAVIILCSTVILPRQICNWHKFCLVISN